MSVWFDNVSGEGVIAFGPVDRVLSHVSLGGARIFEVGYDCGTCGTLFRKIASPANRIDDREAAAMLGALTEVPAPATLQRLARPLPRGRYRVAVLEGRVVLVHPGAPEDFFATEVARLHGKGTDPATPYYRFGQPRALAAREASAGEAALLVTVAMPIHDLSKLDRDRVDHWKRAALSGEQLTALAVAVLNIQAPFDPPFEVGYPYVEQFLLGCCLLDGHHRLQAAAELESPARILVYASDEQSFGGEHLDTVLAALALPPLPVVED